ncbi:TonB-dependent receptor [Sphingomonas sp. HF-S3]|uniref:TonB-dependent receptor n=1 Tax=Sphingomonas rustica TaxID=3103142 RepID=A0ABV0B578_9SPHN
MGNRERDASLGHRLTQLGAASALAVISATLPFQAAWAQSSDGQAAQSQSPAANTATAEDAVSDIVVTANKREQGLSTVAAGISAVSSDTLTTRSADSIADYIAFVPGLSINSYGNTGHGAVSIRGVSPQSVGATTATYVDDIPVGPASPATRGSQFTVDLDPTDLDRVEVLKGPQGTLYGASSMGGVLHYVTRAPNLARTELTASQELNFIDGGEAGVKVRAAISTPIVTGKLAVRASGYYRYSGGYITDLGISGKGANRSRDWGFRGSLKYAPTGNFSIRLDAVRQHSKSDGGANVDYVLATKAPFYGDLEQRRYVAEPFGVDLELYSASINWDLGPGTLVSATSYSKFDTSVQYDATDLQRSYNSIFPVGPATPLGRGYDGSVKKTTQEVRFVSNRFGPVEFMAGGFYQNEDLFEVASYRSFLPSGQIAPVSPRIIANRTAGLTEYAGFANGTFYLTERLDITAGYRYSSIDTDNLSVRTGVLVSRTAPTTPFTSTSGSSENASTYLAGVRWRPTDSLLLYGRAASGYRPGGGRTVPPGSPAGFAPFFTSDSLWSYEAGAKLRTLGGRLLVEFDGFWIDWSNIQALEPVANDATDGNAGKARSKGVEFQASYVPVRGLTLGGNFAYTDGRFTEGNIVTQVTPGQKLYFVPEWTAGAYAEYSAPVSDTMSITFGGDWNTRSSQLDSSRRTLDAYALWNAHAGFQTGLFSVNFYVKNLTDKRALLGSVISNSYRLPYYPFTINQPRTFGIILSQKY